MAALVADASVLAAIVFGEPLAGHASALLRDAELYEPSLLPYELASIARTKILRYPDQRDLLLRALKVGLSIDMHVIEVDQEAVIRLALATGLTTYDATYLYLARSLNVPVVTFDHQLQAASQQQGG